MNVKVPYIIAGPCSAESREQVVQTATHLKQTGVNVFRAGLWKPRTSPYSFEGVGAEGISWLLEVQDKVGLKAATEVATAEHTRLCLQSGIRHIWIGARTTANPFMVQQIVDALKTFPTDIREDTVVMVKNPINPDLDTWCGAIERFRKEGVSNIIAVHRGFSDNISAGGSPMRNNALWSIPLNLRRRMPDIPLICDPSHLTGDNRLVGKVSQQALDLGFSGLMIEVHPTPKEALSDAKQQLSLSEFSSLITSLSVPRNTQQDNSLDALRKEIDAIDASLWQLISERRRVAKEIGELKRNAGFSVYQEQRFSQLLADRLEWAQENDMPTDAVRRIVDALHEIAINAQLER